MSTVDSMFTPAGFAAALAHGVEPTVYLSESVLSGVTVSQDDLSCARCDRPIDLPTRKPALFLAVNAAANDGLCRRCDPPVGPRPPEESAP